MQPAEPTSPLREGSGALPEIETAAAEIEMAAGGRSGRARIRFCRRRQEVSVWFPKRKPLDETKRKPPEETKRKPPEETKRKTPQA